MRSGYKYQAAMARQNPCSCFSNICEVGILKKKGFHIFYKKFQSQQNLRLSYQSLHPSIEPLQLPILGLYKSLLSVSQILYY